MQLRPRNPGRRQTVSSAGIQAPIGGMNTVMPAGGLPELDCIALYNMVGSEYGLRSRLGYREWITGLDGPALTEIPFSGSRANGTSDRLFASTATGIWQCTTSTNSPARPIAFGVTTGLAGHGISAVVATLGGHFLLHCDEENGLYYYSENSGAWTKVVAGTTQAWALQTAYLVGDKVVNGGKVYVVTTAGTSNTTGSGPSGTGTGIADGSVVWNYVSAATSNAIGPSLADQQNGLTLNPSNFAFVTIWKNRVWYLEKDTARAWYGEVNSFLGTFTSFDFGLKLQHGGPLSGLYNWSYDGGSGMDTRLVGISSAGDIIIYAGTDPTSAETFGLVGCWFVGGVPSGRRIATDYGGDILINCSLGTLPLSKLVVGDPFTDRTQYATYKIGNIFSLLANTFGSLPGWALHIHPEDNALLILVPQGSGQPQKQLAYSFSTRGWGIYRDLPMISAGVWNGVLYFGTPDGRICQHTGYVDNVQLADPNVFSPVNWSVLTRYENLGNANQKRITMLIPTITSESPNPVFSVQAKYGFDLSEAQLPTAAPGMSDFGLWDVSFWDAGLWAGDYVPSQPITGALGMGRDVAVAIRGAADSRTILIDVKVMFEQGGLL